MKPYQEILDYWFGPEAGPELWFGADEAADREVRERFSALLDDAVAGKLASWEDMHESCVALVILLDQFSLQLYREEKRSYEQAALALPIAQRAIARGFDAKIGFFPRAFLYMPFMHAEDLGLQERGVELFSQLARDASPEQKESAEGFLEFAKIHRDVVKQYGRFPGRNACYGRASSPAELKYLEEGGEF